LYSAGGNQVFDIFANTDHAPVNLLEGSYRVILEGTIASGGSYNFQLLDAGAAPVLPLDGSAVTGTLNPGVSSTLYSVQGHAGDRIGFHITTSTGSWGWSLWGPGGQPLGGAGDFTATLPSSGTYILMLSGSNTAGPVTYDFTADMVNTTTSPIPAASESTGPTTYTYDPSSTSSPASPTRSATRRSSRSTRPTATS
jgi:hypothetical protein